MCELLTMVSGGPGCVHEPDLRGADPQGGDPAWGGLGETEVIRSMPPPAYPPRPTPGNPVVENVVALGSKVLGLNPDPTSCYPYNLVQIN